MGHKLMFVRLLALSIEVHLVCRQVAYGKEDYFLRAVATI